MTLWNVIGIVDADHHKFEVVFCGGGGEILAQRVVCIVARIEGNAEALDPRDHRLDEFGGAIHVHAVRGARHVRAGLVPGGISPATTGS